MRFPFTRRSLGFLTTLGLMSSLALPALAQTTGVGIGTTTFTPDGSALLELRSTTQGLLAPRMTAAQRAAIANPAPGLLVYQTDGLQLGLWQNQGNAAAPSWQRLGADGLGDHTATQNINLGTHKLTGNGSTLGIGVASNGGLQMGDVGSGNLFIGQQAGRVNTGSFNQFVGVESGYSNTSGSYNHFSGLRAGASNTSGFNNYFSGFGAGYSNTTGEKNYFSGNESGYSNTTGYNNFFVGQISGADNTIGYNNHFSGYRAGRNNVSGNTNHFSGYESGFANTSGNRNVFIGPNSGGQNTTGTNNLALGYLAGPTTGNLTNAGAIGYRAQVSQSNSLVLGGTGADAVKVGIGTTAPTQALEVAGSVKLSGTGNGLYFPDGTIQTTAATGSGGTASNGLTKTGNDIALGGTLAGATQVATNGNAFSFVSSISGDVVDQSSQIATTSSLDLPAWQSFTAGAAGQLSKIDVRLKGSTFGPTSGTITLSVYNGTGTSGTLLTSFSQSVTLVTDNAGAVVTFTLPTPLTLAAATVYTFRLASTIPAAASHDCSALYPGGNDSFSGGCDLIFRTYLRSSAAPIMALNPAGNVGMGTSSPTQKLEVAGNVHISGTGNGLRFPDGTTQTTAATGGSTTASSGLTKTGNDIALGGTLAENTVIIQANKTFAFTGGNVGLASGSMAEITSPVTLGGAMAVPFVETTTGSSFALNSLHQTVRRINSCNLMTLPDPSTCRGRLYTIINSASGGTVSLSLSVTGGTSIYDDVLGNSVSSLASAKRLTVQSSGSMWIVTSRD